MINISQTQYGHAISCNTSRKFYVAYNKDLKQCVKTSNTARLDYAKHEDCQYAINRAIQEIKGTVKHTTEILNWKKGLIPKPQYVYWDFQNMSIDKVEKHLTKYNYILEILEGCEVYLVDETTIKNI